MMGTTECPGGCGCTFGAPPLTRPHLGARVRIIEAADIKGIVVAETRHIDGTTTFTVEFWHNGDRCNLNCEPRELEVTEGAVS